MDDAERARAAAEAAVADVEPEPLHEALSDRLASASMAPGALALLTVRTLDAGVDVDLDAVAERAAGVQLIYEGLRLTRQLAHDEPWADADLTATPSIPADLEILAADVLVSRGFYLLARTDAADRAVEVVRSFGRDQTNRETASDPATLDQELEADTLALAVAVGACAVDRYPPTPLVEFGREVARSHEGPFPPAGTVLSEAVVERFAALSAGGDADADAGDDRVPSATDS
jgi:hypothetical protein